mmetsp:Transcript_21794/g.39364  ORF Transcript_21794/g.39364 Transcript_21794/m.39364 type:complete len:136 (+) Transcript_21794:28-435(+)
MDSSTINTQHLTEEHVEKDFEQLSNTNRLVTDTVTSIWHASLRAFYDAPRGCTSCPWPERRASRSRIHSVLKMIVSHDDLTRSNIQPDCLINLRLNKSVCPSIVHSREIQGPAQGLKTSQFIHHGASTLPFRSQP